MATEVALADEVAAASGLVMAKDARVPVAMVRGVDRLARRDAPAAALVRPADEDLFGSSPIAGAARPSHDPCVRPGRRADGRARGGDRRRLHRAGATPLDAWRFSVLRSPAARRRYLAAMAEAWRADLRADGTDEAVIDGGSRRSGAVLRAAPVLIVPWLLASQRARDYGDAERAEAERNMLVLSGGRGDPEPAARAVGPPGREQMGRLVDLLSARRLGPRSGSTTSGSRWAPWPAGRCRRDRVLRHARRSMSARSPTGSEARVGPVRWRAVGYALRPRRPPIAAVGETSARDGTTTDGHRPTKAERKEQARLEREALQRRMAAKKRNRTIGFAFVALAVVAAVVAIVVLQPGSTDAALPAPADLLAQAPAAATAAGCTEVETTEFYGGRRPDLAAIRRPGPHRGRRAVPGHAPARYLSEHPAASGPHVGETTLPAGVYDSTPGSRAADPLTGARGHRRLARPRRAAGGRRRDRILLRPVGSRSGKTE